MRKPGGVASLTVIGQSEGCGVPNFGARTEKFRDLQGGPYFWHPTGSPQSARRLLLHTVDGGLRAS
jgi:hypothetical protein